MDDICSQTRLDIDLSFYKAMNIDLQVLTDDQIIEHYHRYGEGEGRPASPLSFVGPLMSSVKPTEDVLEIGPFVNPIMLGNRVKYFDVLDSQGLVSRAASLGYSGQVAPKINYVSSSGDLTIVEEASFDVVFSSHCIEHVPDLIEHLNRVARILRPNGRYILMIPDKRYCSDHYVPASTIADVVQASHDLRTTQTVANFIETYALGTHNDTRRHWAGDHGVQKIFEDPNAILTAIQMHNDAQGGYTDLHAWRFTPRSFRDLLMKLFSVQFTRMRPDCVLGTGRDSNTFVAILRPLSM